MKFIKYILVYIFVLIPALSYASEKIIDRIVAEVDNEIITFRQLEKEALPIVTRIKALGYDAEKEKSMIKDVKAKMLDNLIDEKIAEISAKKSNIVVNEKDVDNFINMVRKEQNISMEQFSSALKQQGFSIADYKKRLKKQILKKRLIDYEVRSKIVITDDQVKAYYKSHPEKYMDEKEYHIWHITFIKNSSSLERWGNVTKEAEKLHYLIEKKHNFIDIAKNIDKYKDGFEIVSGDLGYFKLKDLSSEVRDAVKKLHKGGVSSLVSNFRGIQIFYLADIKVNKAKTVEEASSEITRILYAKEVEKKFGVWIKNLKKHIHIKKID